MTLTTEQVAHLQAQHTALVDAVRRMRGYQKEWFKYHSSLDLKAAKAWERKVDELLTKEVNAQKQQQQELKF